jgi:hypothetical protein
MPPLSERDNQRRQRIIAGLRGRDLQNVVDDPVLLADMRAESESTDEDKLVPRDLMRQLDAVRVNRPAHSPLSLFFSTDDVIIVPGFMGSELSDLRPVGPGLIWVDPKLVLDGSELLALRLAKYEKDRPDRDADGARIGARGAVPLIYQGLKLDLELRRYDVRIFGFDWRKNIEEAAIQLADLIRERSSRRFRPLHVIAHSQGTLVARRALQNLGIDLARRLVNNVILLGPATGGTFSAAFALAGSHETIEAVRRFGVNVPDGFTAALQSMSGLYQLLPWRPRRVEGVPPDPTRRNDQLLEWLQANIAQNHAENPDAFNAPGFWKSSGIDKDRLAAYFGWGKRVDASFLNDRTTIILGDQDTVGGVKFDGKRLIADPNLTVPGDGTVPDALAVITGVTRVYKARGTEHMMLPATLSVLGAVRDILAGRLPLPAQFAPGAEKKAVAADAGPATTAGKAPPSQYPYLAEPDPGEVAELMAVAAPSPAAARRLRKRGRIPSGTNRARADAAPARAAGAPAKAAGPPKESEPGLESADELGVATPQERRLRVFSFDPLFATELDALGAESIVLAIPWDFADSDALRPGPVGEYIEVIDYDPANRCFYPPVDLNHPHLLAQDGVPLSEGDPQFHQQMVYAVVMNTIREFEKALGRVSLWCPRMPRLEADDKAGRPDDAHDAVAASTADAPATPNDKAGARAVALAAGAAGGGSVADDEGGHHPEYDPEVDDLTAEELAQINWRYVPRLRVYPHAMRQANAFYDPTRKALLFGYFNTEGPDVGRNLPGGTVFSCLSFDIIAHETTHALLDGLHRYLIYPSNGDVFAFHEAFADVVALFQHFSHPDVLKHQLSRTRGDLGGEGMLGVLAAQFGEALGHHGALRSYLGEKVPDPVTGEFTWKSVAPDHFALSKITEPHARGAILVAALFRAFANIYENRVKDLRRIATNGTGVLPDGDLHPDLVDRLAGEASKAAQHMLTMCIRALDYVPPVDLTFGEYLRALITADYDLVRNDDRRYRVSVVSAFRDWGIYPDGVRSLSVDSLLWSPPEVDTILHPCEFFQKARLDGWRLRGDRYASFVQVAQFRKRFHSWLLRDRHLREGRDEFLGLSLEADAPSGIRRNATGPVFEVHSIRPCQRIGPDGQVLRDTVVEIVQKRLGFFDEAEQCRVDKDPAIAVDPKLYKRAKARSDFEFRGGCTLIIDPDSGDIRYCIKKPIFEGERLAKEREFRQGPFGDKVGGIYLADDRTGNPFAFLHGTC